MPTYLPQQAQKFIITQQSAGVKIRTQDVNSIHHFVMNTALDMNEFGVSYSNIYNNFSVLYPLIGTTSDSHKFNLINPSISVVNNLSYQGAPTQSDGYIQLSGDKSQWLDTNFNMSALTVTNFHTSYYSVSSSTASGVDILIRGLGGSSLEFSIGDVDGSGKFGVAEFDSPSLSSATIPWDTSYGLITFSKNGDPLNTSGLKTNGIFSSYSIPTWPSIMTFLGNLIIGSSSNIVSWDSNTTKRNLGLLSAGTSLTSEQSKSYTNAANKLISNKGIVTYATFDTVYFPIGGILSNNNLTAYGVNTFVSNVSVNTGKWYWEMTMISGATNNLNIGVISGLTGSSSINLRLSENANQFAPGRSNGFSVWNTGTETNFAAALYSVSNVGTGSVIGVFLDLINLRLSFSVNGSTYSAVGQNAFGTWALGYSYRAAISNYTAGVSASYTANFGQSPFVYTNTVPSDYNLGLYNGTKGPY